MIDALLVWLSLAVAAPAAPDTLVVCPAEFRAALEPWATYRRGQAHEIVIVDPPSRASELRSLIRGLAAVGSLKYIVLIGDVPTGRDTLAVRRLTISTNYVAAQINTRWGSEPQIATDAPYADVDGDGTPDLVVGRIPADSPAELTAVVRKILRYEQQVDDAHDPAWQRRLHVVAGIGGFGVLADSLVEAAGRQVIQQTVPADYDVQPTMASPASPHCPPPGEFRSRVRQQLCDGCLAWIYLGHGRPTELDRVATPRGAEPILSVHDVSHLQCGAHSPLAVLVACYTGALDARTDCLGEELLLAEQGPVAVIAATRVTMPYGNTVLGYELLRACFHDRPTSLGEAMRLAQCRTLKARKDDKFRASLDSLAQGVSPAPADLHAELREHVLMYHIFGDPLLRLRLAAPDVTRAVGGAVAE